MVETRNARRRSANGPTGAYGQGGGPTPLFPDAETPPRCRRLPASSRAAYAKSQRGLGRKQQAVFDAIRAAGALGASVPELVSIMDWPINCISCRVSELSGRTKYRPLLPPVIEPLLDELGQEVWRRGGVVWTARELGGRHAA
jgi:hypothetical protein